MTMIEVFKDIPEYGGLYQASNFGRVYSNYNGGRFLKLTTSSKGYHRITLCGELENKNVFVHRIIAALYVEGYREDLYVNHIDENKTNNHYTNLEWCTAAENNKHSCKKILDGVIKSNAKKYLVTFPCGKIEVVYNLSKFSREWDLNQSHMVATSRGTRKQHKGFKCEFIGEDE